MPMLVDACPGFRCRWNDYLEASEDEERSIYNDVAEFAQYLVDACGSGATGECPPAFSAVERLMSDGDQETREVALVGIIEYGQTLAAHRPCGDQVFLRWLGPVSASSWRQIEAVWRGDLSLADAVRGAGRRVAGDRREEVGDGKAAKR